MLYIKRQISGADFVNFRGLLRKYELYFTLRVSKTFTNKAFLCNMVPFWT